MPDVIAIARDCGLSCIEWAGDTHVPPGNIELATQVRKDSEATGLFIKSYGSYYRCEDEEYREVLRSAQVLGAPNIRVWAGKLGSGTADRLYRDRIVQNLQRLCEDAQRFEITISAEYHTATLTDSLNSSLELVEEVGSPIFRLYWQPFPERTHEERKNELISILPFLSNLHVFHWKADGEKVTRHHLEEAEEQWRDYLAIAEGMRCVFLEFVSGDSVDALRADAQTLVRLAERE